jgi:hypothetical protein
MDQVTRSSATTQEILWITGNLYEYFQKLTGLYKLLMKFEVFYQIQLNFGHLIQNNIEVTISFWIIKSNLPFIKKNVVTSVSTNVMSSSNWQLNIRYMHWMIIVRFIIIPLNNFELLIYIELVVCKIILPPHPL